MNETVLTHWRRSPTLVRVVPFVVFLALTSLQGQFGEASRYWVYALKTGVGAALIWSVWPWVSEMRWKLSWDGFAAGVVVFVMWAGLDGWYPSLDGLLRGALCPVARHLGFEQWCASAASPPKGWNPHEQFSPAVAWAIIVVRIAGSSLVVPPLEEVFYRSFLYRYINRPDFQQLPLNCLAWVPFLVTAAIFGFAHYEWLPGILCAMIYQGLVIRRNRLGDAMTAHATTNFLLGLWVVWKGAWHFW